MACRSKSRPSRCSSSSSINVATSRASRGVGGTRSGAGSGRQYRKDRAGRPSIRPSTSYTLPPPCRIVNATSSGGRSGGTSRHRTGGEEVTGRNGSGPPYRPAESVSRTPGRLSTRASAIRTDGEETMRATERKEGETTGPQYTAPNLSTLEMGASIRHAQARARRRRVPGNAPQGERRDASPRKACLRPATSVDQNDQAHTDSPAGIIRRRESVRPAFPDRVAVPRRREGGRQSSCRGTGQWTATNRSSWAR